MLRGSVHALFVEIVGATIDFSSGMGPLLLGCPNLQCRDLCGTWTLILSNIHATWTWFATVMHCDL